MYLYECKVNYERRNYEGDVVNVKEVFLIEGSYPSDAENKLIEEIKPDMFGDSYTIESIKKRRIFEIIPHSNDRNEEMWYEAKVEMITVDGDKEVRTAVTILVEHRDFDYALQLLHSALGSYDCEVVGLKKSPIVEVLRA